MGNGSYAEVMKELIECGGYDMYDKEFNDYAVKYLTDANNHDSLGKHLWNKLKYNEYLLEQETDWSSDLGILIMDIYRSGLLADSKFADRIKDIYNSLDV